jgi:chromosome segregation ATPase
MSEQRSTWLQRLVGSDNSPTLALEEQLQTAREEAQRLAAELASERERAAERDRVVQDLLHQASSAEQDFEARLVAIRHSTDERLAELDQQLKATSAELSTARSQLARLRDEATKLSKALANANANLARADGTVQAARAQATEAEGKLASAEDELRQARAQTAALAVAAESTARELAEQKLRLEASDARATALEKRATTAERALAQGKQAWESAKTEAERLASQLHRAEAERLLAERTTRDSFRALARSLGDGAPLALTLGVDTAAVEVGQSVGAAVDALKSALLESTPYRVDQLEWVDDGVTAALHGAPSMGRDEAAQWLVAYSVAFLERATGLELSVESSELAGERVTYRLRHAASAA